VYITRSQHLKIDKSGDVSEIWTNLGCKLRKYAGVGECPPSPNPAKEWKCLWIGRNFDCLKQVTKSDLTKKIKGSLRLLWKTNGELGIDEVKRKASVTRKQWKEG
jgi:hypothetical protein